MLLFTFSGSYLNLFMGWELVGFVSFLLVGFYGSKRAIFASNKVILINRIADLFLLSAIILIYRETGTLEITKALPDRISHHTADIIAICISVAAMAKSAQFPFHFWLLDAMEAPTPVSALLHAATMVASGVYLINLSYVFYDQAVLNFLMVVATITILWGGILGVTNRNMKKILASSTMSQLGFMFFAISLGKSGLPIALFYLFMHAALKASLFLTVGDVMLENNNELDIEKVIISGKTKFFLTANYALNALSLIGMPPLAIYFAKDKLLGYSHHLSSYYLIVPIIGSCMTSLYMSRMFMRAFVLDKDRKTTEPLLPKLRSQRAVAIVAMTLLSLASPILSLNEFFFRQLSSVYSFRIEEFSAGVYVSLLEILLIVLVTILSLQIFKSKRLKYSLGKFAEKIGASFSYEFALGSLVNTCITVVTSVGVLIQFYVKRIEKGISIMFDTIAKSVMYLHNRVTFEIIILVSLIVISSYALLF
jgi:NADH-quinone oxidoreductase subunit L